MKQYFILPKTGMSQMKERNSHILRISCILKLKALSASLVIPSILTKFCCSCKLRIFISLHSKTVVVWLIWKYFYVASAQFLIDAELLSFYANL